MVPMPAEKNRPPVKLGSDTTDERASDHTVRYPEPPAAMAGSSWSPAAGEIVSLPGRKTRGKRLVASASPGAASIGPAIARMRSPEYRGLRECFMSQLLSSFVTSRAQADAEKPNTRMLDARCSKLKRLVEAVE